MNGVGGSGVGGSRVTLGNVDVKLKPRNSYRLVFVSLNSDSQYHGLRIEETLIPQSLPLLF